MMLTKVCRGWIGERCGRDSVVCEGVAWQDNARDGARSPTWAATAVPAPGRPFPSRVTSPMPFRLNI